MGCSQSTSVPTGAARAAGAPPVSAAGGPQPLPATRPGGAAVTRDRIDSWAVSHTSGTAAPHTDLEVPASGSGSSEPGPLPVVRPAVSPTTARQRKQPPPRPQAPPPPPTVESQWRFLWETQAPHLLDPADVHAALDALLCQTINLLSPVELTLLQRRVRGAVQGLSAAAASAGKARAVFAGGGGGSAHKAESAEAQSAVERNHWMTEWLVMQRILPRHCPAAVHRNACTLLRHLSEALWDRVADVAALTAAKAQLELDVNKRPARLRMPKPSVVPDVSPAEAPAGITLPALSFLLAIARRGSRRQRTLLLFYLLLEGLPEFLAGHPAGGVPTWLLEADRGTVLSLASLAHYHYFGHGGYLPVPDGAVAPRFCRSASRPPLTVPAARVRQFIEAMLVQRAPVAVAAATADVSDADAADPAASAFSSRRGSKTQPQGRGSGGTTSRRGSDASNADNTRQASDSDGAVADTTYYPNTILMRQLAAAGERGWDADESNRLSKSLNLLKKLQEAETEEDGQLHLSPSRRKRREESGSSMTLQDFVDWVNVSLDDAMLDTLMHRLFTSGILPTPILEKELVQDRWREWESCFEDLLGNGRIDKGDALAQSVTSLFSSCVALSEVEVDRKINVLSQAAWGGIGGIDGGGAMGCGVLYCIDKKWWDNWTAYVGWSFLAERPCKPYNSNRPGALSTERLLESKDELMIRGSLGSYELMKDGLQLNADYVLVPPGVWAVLYELYGGGPPLPRIVKPASRKITDFNRTSTDLDDSFHRAQPADDLDNLVESLDTVTRGRVKRIPETISVALHPWIIHAYLCDPAQPYRRGEAGLMSVRLMTLPDAPLWRMVAEVIVRFPLHTYKAYGGDNKGKCRIWKKCEQNHVAANRYGPWNLLLKSRTATVPYSTANGDFGEQRRELVENWKTYTDNATVESSGLYNGDHIMLEFMVLNKNSELAWPREAAAKAGKVRRIAEEDAKFRTLIQGLNEKGERSLKPPHLQGLAVDAMDASGRWYPVTILEADTIDEDIENGDEGCEINGGRLITGKVSRRKVRVDFTEFGGHQEWIDVDSDRLAKLGRFTNDGEDQASVGEPKVNGSSGQASNEAKTKPAAPIKKASAVDSERECGKVCPWPGFGACGLTNLGNTCYSNSAIQCISYLPVLRSYLLSSQYKTAGDLNKDNPLGTGGKLLEEFADLLRVLWSAKVGEKSPSKFRTQLGKVNSQFAGADQQDAQEFLNYILDMLHEDSNKVRKKPYVEAADDDWVGKSGLSRVGEETWRRFLRRNRSIMTDVAMGQVLNTVTCPTCKYTSKNFDPFNLLSIPIPTVADVVFKCTVFRRATALNCPWVLNKPRKGDKNTFRYLQKMSSSPLGPPSETYVAEEYVVAMSRLADLGDFRLKLQNTCGIPAYQLRLCRQEIISSGPNLSTMNHQMKITALADKEGPCSQLVKKRAPGEKGPTPPTLIIAFESTIRSRSIPPAESKDELLEDTADEDEELDDNFQLLPTPREQAQIEKYLEVYGDYKECRLVDTNPLVIAKAVSRSLWPRTENELKLGLRVDAKDQRGNWFPGNVIEIVTDSSALSNGGSHQRKVRVHFDNFSSKWDELYGIEDFREGRVRPLYAHAASRPKPTEFIVHHRYTDTASGRSVMFGQPFYIQCQNDWSNARAGAHIIAQTSRFIRQDTYSNEAVGMEDGEGKIRRLYEKMHLAMSDLIDLLIDCDREYIRLALAVSEHNTEEERMNPYRNPSFDPTPLSTALVKKVANLLQRLPFEVRVSTLDAGEADKTPGATEEIPFPFSLIRTIGNYINARHIVILHWREPPVDKKTGSLKNYLDSPVLYIPPVVEVDAASAKEHKDKMNIKKDEGNSGRGGTAGIELGVCLTEFCKVQSLSITDNWRCPRCKEFREGQQSMRLWRLPDLLTFHIKRFNMSARWREKITTKVNFPLTGLDMSEWFHTESSSVQQESQDAYIYDLIGVVNHYGSMTGGHYVAICKASACGREGQEEVAYSFNGPGTTILDEDEEIDSPGGWRLGRPKTEAAASQSKAVASLASQAAAESAEPLWLQFDDELVEAIPPEQVVSELAYVLFYRRRRMTSSNVAKYSTLD